MSLSFKKETRRPKGKVVNLGDTGLHWAVCSVTMTAE